MTLNKSSIRRSTESAAFCHAVDPQLKEYEILSLVGATEGQRFQPAGFRVKDEASIRLAVIGKYANVFALPSSSYLWAFIGTDGIVHGRSSEPVACDSEGH
jgi:hypothetical protein